MVKLLGRFLPSVKNFLSRLARLFGWLARRILPDSVFSWRNRALYILTTRYNITPRRIVRVTKRAILFLALAALALIVVYSAAAPLAKSLFEPTRTFIIAINPTILDSTTVGAYYGLVATIAGLIYLVILVVLWHRIFTKIIIRNQFHLYSLFDLGNARRPAPDRASLYCQFTDLDFIEVATARSNGQFRKLDRIIDHNIAPISTFLDRGNWHGNILLINSRWGTGKTTSLLIAIDELCQLRNRYIYESVFKYQDNLGDFINDLLRTLDDTLQELGARIPYLIDRLAENLQANLSQTVLGFIRGAHKFPTFSTELVDAINRRYFKKNYKTYKSEANGQEVTGFKNEIVIIVDDLDRMQGDDIVKVLSLLSVLRRLNFVKIIIPADQWIIVSTLTQHKVADPARFIKKYLPEQQTVNLEAGYPLAREVAYIAVRSRNSSLKDARPAFAAILFRCIASKLIAETKLLPSRPELDWLRSSASLPTEFSQTLRTILHIPAVCVRRSKAGFSKVSADYYWDSGATSVYRLEDFLLKLRRRRTNAWVAKRFTDKSYTDIIAAWIFDYTEQHWDDFGLVPRDILDAIHSIDLNSLPAGPAAQFRAVYNQLFPDAQLE